MVRKEGGMKNFEKIVLAVDSEQDYTIQDIVQLCDVSYCCVFGAIRRGSLASRKIFGRHYIPGREIIKYLTRQ